MYKNICIVIPSLDPDQKLTKLLTDLSTEGFFQIILIDDGSNNMHKFIFSEISNKYPNIIILKNYINLGKGRSLKYAFNYILNEMPTIKGIITADSDGQHSVSDIQKCAQILNSEMDDSKVLILGCRNFNSENIPFKSKFGNKITRTVLKFLCGVSVTDTQTGLRGLTRKSIEVFLNTSGERFEYETNMLIETKSKNIKIKEFPIETIYLMEDGILNKTSHFNPLKDSIRIYLLFFKFISASIISFLIDIIFFIFFCGLFDNIIPTYSIIISTLLARIISSFYNYLINRKIVFKSNTSKFLSFIKYTTLCITQAIISGILVTTIINNFFPYKIITKMLIDSLLFFINFGIQRDFIFNNTTEEKLQ